MKRHLILLVAGIPALTMALALGAEEAPGKGGEKAGGEGRAARKDRGDRRRGVRGDPRRGRGGRPPWAGRRGNPAEEEMRLVSARDAACLGLAQLHFAMQDQDKAVAVLTDLIKDTEDENAKGFARIWLARIYRQQKKADEATAELKKVKGLGVIRAIDMLLLGVEDRTAKLEELLKEAAEPLARAVIIRRLIREYARKRDADKMADLVKRARKLLSAREAAKALEDELKLASAEAGGGANRGDRGRMPDREEMRKRADQMRTQMKERIAKLEKEGKKEEAAKLRERMERMERMIKRFREGAGGGRWGGRDRGGQEGGRKPEPKVNNEEF